jgi:hypothetical protein
MRSEARARLCQGIACLLAAGSVVAGLLVTRGFTHVPPDAAHYGIIARHLLRGEGYVESVIGFHPATYESVRHIPELHGLLRPFALVPWVAILGAGPVAIRMPGLLYTALAGLVVFWWGGRLFGPVAALLACALTLLNANLLFYGLLGADDVGFAFYFTAMLATLDWALATGRDRGFLLAGCLGGLALLEKGAGLFFPAVFLVSALRLRDTPPRRVGRWLALLFVPLMGALGIYLARNWLAYGSLQFRFAVLNWVWKLEGFEGWTQVFDRTPPLLEMLDRLGWDRVAQVVWTQVRRFVALIVRVRPLAEADPLGTLTAPAFLPVLALLGLPLVARRVPITAWLVAASVAGSATFICLLYSAEVRYFSMLVPAVALVVAGLVAAGAGSDVRAVRLGSVAGAALVLVLATVAYGRTVRTLVTFPGLDPCPVAVRWIAAHTPADARILTFNPWFVGWAADREAIMTPSGGVDQIVRIARRYDVRWLLAERTSSRPRTSEVVMQLPGAESLRVSTEFEAGGCRVYRLEPGVG